MIDISFLGIQRTQKIPPNLLHPVWSRERERERDYICRNYFRFLSRVISEKELKQKPHTIILILKHLKINN